MKGAIRDNETTKLGRPTPRAQSVSRARARISRQVQVLYESQIQIKSEDKIPKSKFGNGPLIFGLDFIENDVQFKILMKRNAISNFLTNQVNICQKISKF